MVKKRERRQHSELWRPLLPAVLAAAGILLQVFGLIEVRQALRFAKEYSDYWWVAAMLICLQALLFTLAMPGSLFLWVVAPIYSPVIATVILVAGSALGALGGYHFSRKVAESRLSRIRKNRFFSLLARRGDFLTQCALRTFPGFPHSVVNYSAGILGLPLYPFLVAAILGISIKTFLYAGTIHRAVMMTEPSDLNSVEILGPLAFLALLFILAQLFRRHLSKTQGDKGDHRS